MAAVQRNVLVLRLPMVLAVHLRLPYDSEHEVGDLVAAGGEWADAQDAALGLRGLPPQDTCRAALALYRDAAAGSATCSTRGRRPCSRVRPR